MGATHVKEKWQRRIMIMIMDNLTSILSNRLAATQP